MLYISYSTDKKYCTIVSVFRLHVRASSMWVRASKHKVDTSIHRHRSDVIGKMDVGGSIYARLGNRC